MSAPLCPTHGKPGKLVYPCCTGALGGRSTSAAKRASATVNVAKARAVQAAKRAAQEETR